ncbi:hypothetical protein PR003_g21789 [Phytophthora rubi]|uniref:Uncharacterized protein n=1 Tax=Phytophthora rubi TaxID=129364 RepID=A0A6A3JE80_9STRA|nr:hypothetical protein PR001_g20906 [Phytophthora rubi]KAE9027204.1 hypothetical protein PR002_g10728 [Phytophthora rubi]KAE9304268.1 hypothetical protein PR003_g21789 [Phytophthora rubi]
MSDCPCGMPFPTTDKCSECGRAAHVYCMDDSNTVCKWCLKSTSGKRKARQEGQTTANKKTKASKSTKSASDASSDTESELSETESIETVAVDTSQTLQLQRLKLLRLRAKVAKYQARAHEYKAKAMEAHFAAETFAARLKLQTRGVSESDINSCLPSL